MTKEIKKHEERHHWELLNKSDVPKGNKIIPSVWAFKRKRTPDGIISKYKSRLCAHGGRQQWGINYY